MRIAVVIDAWAPIVGGGQTQVWELSTRLVQNFGYEIDIFTRDLGEKEHQFKPIESYYDNKLRVIRVGPRVPFFSFFGRVVTISTLTLKIIEMHKQKKYDLIHAHVYLGALVGKLASYFTHLPLVLTVHGTNLTDMNASGLSAWLEKQICFAWKYNHVIGVGNGYKKYKNVNKALSIIPNGVDVAAFDKVLAVKEKYFKILFVGRLEWTKGVDILIQAIGKLREKNIQLYIVGYGYEEEKYRKMVKDAHLENVIFFKGRLTKEDLISEYKSSNLYVLSSRTEGDSLTIKEAWAAQLPVIATRCNAPEFYVEDGVDGWLVEKENPEALSKKISKVIDMDKTVFEGVGNKGYEKVRQQFTWEMAAQKTNDVYMSMSFPRRRAFVPFMGKSSR